MTTEDTVPDWRITGDWWDLCNCAIGCPCNFGSNPTYGFCEGVLTWLIRDGNYGDLKLAKDLAVVLIIHWEGNVFEKNREFGFLIDDRANPEERVAEAVDHSRYLNAPVLGIVGDSHRHKLHAVQAECQIAPRLERAACEACEDLL